MLGEACRWAAILSDPSLVSVVYIAVQIPWVRRLSQYLEGAMGLPFTNLFASCCTSHVCIRRQVHYPLYCPWPHVLPHVLVVILLALLLCYASKQVAGNLG